jgi:hypothetical protein
MDDERASRELRHLVDQYRATCLWFLREHYYPDTSDQVERVLSLIVQHGDREALRRVATVRRWLSLPSNATSAAR